MITVGMLTHNRKITPVLALQSLIFQPLVKEIIVLDNGFGRNLPEEFWSVAEVCRAIDIEFKYVMKDCSLAEGRKYLYENASQRFLFYADDDMIYPPDFISQLINAPDFFIGKTFAHGCSTLVVPLSSPIGDYREWRKSLPESGYDHEVVGFGGTQLLPTGWGGIS